MRICKQSEAVKSAKIKCLVPQMLNGMINVGTVDCQKYHSLCQGEGVRAYPEIRLYPPNANRRDTY